MQDLMLRDVVVPLPEAEFYSDVQLASYRRPENAELVSKYIFSSKATAGRKSATDLLKATCEAFVASNPNRFTFIANYGHGKSHLALVLANFFGKAYDSTEVASIIEGLDHVLEDNRPQYRFFKDFKHERGSFLVLTLSGDNPKDLRSQFFKALDEALEEHSDLENQTLPFWFAGAEQFLERIPPEMKPQAEDFLSSRDMDLQLLTHKVKERDGTAESVCTALHEELYGTSPAFASSYSLAEAVTWIVDNLCGSDQPFAGLLIFFDEFSAFVQRYSRESSQYGGAPLQDLLNGIDHRRGRAALVALSQQDPSAIAEGTLKGSSQTLDNVKKELDRLPHAQRYLIHSSLESVLDAYLRQYEEEWQQLNQSREFSRTVVGAGAAAFRAFERRYKQSLQWDRTHFDDVMVKGCFPLHPMTTALLATVELRNDPVSPRRVLGFVVEHVNSHLNGPASVNGVPNWISPIALVDYFGDTLEKQHYQDYTAALTQAGGVEADDEHKAVLKAMLLQLAGSIEYKEIGYEKVISELSGVSESRTSQSLTELHGASVIRRDPANRFYSFWPSDMSPHKVEEHINYKLQGKRLQDQRVLDEINEHLYSEGLLKPKLVEVGWGHQDDWGATQLLLDSGSVDSQGLKYLISRHLKWEPDKQSKSRGLLIRLLAENDKQVESLGSDIQDTLDSSLGKEHWPLLVLCPDQPSPHLPDLLLRFYGLCLFNNADIQDVGEAQHKEVKRATKQQLQAALGNSWQSGAYEAPEFFRHKLETLPQKQEQMVLREIYQMAYYKGPKKFFPQYKHTASGNLTKAVSFVMVDLLGDNVGGSGALLKNDKVAQEIRNNFLNKEWSILDEEQRVQPPPTASPLHHGWQRLEDYFEAGAAGMPVDSVLRELLNPPYGYDFNTFTLLFAAWYGYHHQDIVSFSYGGLSTSMEEMVREKSTLKKPKDLLPDLAKCFISRRDVSQREREIEKLIEKVKRGDRLKKSEVRSGIQNLESLNEDKRVNSNLKRDAKEALASLQHGLEVANDYDQKSERIRRKAEGKPELSEVISLLQDVRRLPEVTSVQTDELDPHELIERLNAVLEQTTDRLCHKYEALEKTDDYGLHERELKSGRTLLSQEGVHVLVDRVDKALKQLQHNRKELQKKEKDAQVAERLDQIQTKGDLASLRGAEEAIESLPVYSAEVGQRATEKLEAVQTEIQRLESFAEGLKGRLNDLVRLAELRSFRDELLKHLYLFEETEEHNSVDAAFQRTGDLENVFSGLQELHNQKVHDPVEVHELLQKCDTLEAEYKDSLSKRHQTEIKHVRQAVENKGAVEHQRALEWLAERENKLASIGSEPQRLEDLLLELQAPPAFLPAEEQGRLDNCRQEAQTRIDSDEVLQVERHFKKIADPSKRLECLERIRRLTEDTDSP